MGDTSLEAAIAYQRSKVRHHQCLLERLEALRDLAADRERTAMDSSSGLVSPVSSPRPTPSRPSEVNLIHLVVWWICIVVSVAIVAGGAVSVAIRGRF